MRVLVIASHPDDEVFGCGGTIARHVGQGDEVHVLVVTRGVPEMFPSAQIEETWRELRAAHDTLGVSETHSLNFPAARLDTVPGHEVADAIRRSLIELKPRVVYFPHRGDIHSDHRCVYYATLVAARPINGCSVRSLLCYETPSETTWAPPFGDDAFIPAVFVDISQYLEIKLQAAACYRSQLKNPPHPRSLEALKAQARLRGSTVCFSAAEAFMLVREIVG